MSDQSAGPSAPADSSTATIQAPANRRPRWSQFPIRTQLPQVPWLWAGLMQGSWFVGLYIESCSTQTMTFTLKKFVESPMLITLVMSLNTAYNMLVGATCNYLSDKVWTPLGRRKPFLIASCAASITCLILIPFISSFWLLVVLLVFYEAARDLGSPSEALINEVVPPQQRGRAGIIRTFMQQGSTYFFFTVMLAHFDNKYQLTERLTVSGEMLIYWVGALLAAALAAFYLFAVREERPVEVVTDAQPQRAVAAGGGPLARLGRFLAGFLRDAYADRQMRMIYLLIFAAQGTWLGLGNLAPLLYTEQWNYDKVTYGKIIGYSTPIVLLVAPIAGVLVDKLNRLKLFTYGLVLIILQHIGFYIYCRYFAPNGVPSVVFLIAYPLCFALIGQTASLAAITTVFDHIPSSRLGTFGSGWGLLSAITTLAITNGLAMWVELYSRVFPRPGVKYDYLSGYQYLIALCLVFLACALLFAREEKKGNLIKYGVLEREAAAAKLREEAAAEA